MIGSKQPIMRLRFRAFGRLEIPFFCVDLIIGRCFVAA